MPFFAQYNQFGVNVYICYDYVYLDNLSDINVYMCYDYVHLDNLSDVSAYRNHNIQQCKMEITQKTHTA